MGRKKKIQEDTPGIEEAIVGKNIPKKLRTALKSLEEKFGVGSIKFASSEDLTIQRVATGIKLLDDALGGGFPIGGISELYGIESGGKSTIVAKLIANVQKQGGLCAYIDAEKALEKDWLEKLGVDWANLLHTEMTEGNQVFDTAKKLLESKEVKLLIVDSIAAIVPPVELEEDMAKQSMGNLAKLVNKGLRVTNSVNSRVDGTAIIFINQLRDKLGIMFGNPTTTPGGKGMKYFASIRVEVKRGEWYPDRKNREGFEVICQIVKNKTSVPYTEARFVLMTDGKIFEWDELKKKKGGEE